MFPVFQEGSIVLYLIFLNENNISVLVDRNSYGI